MKKKLFVGLSSVLGFLSLPISAFAQMYDRYSANSYSTSTASNSATALFFIVYFLTLCIILAVWVAICVWVYRDAKKHNVENPGLWVLLVLFMSIPGIILYLLLGRKK